MAGLFECKPASNRQFMFNLKAGRHEVILTIVLLGAYDLVTRK